MRIEFDTPTELLLTFCITFHEAAARMMIECRYKCMVLNIPDLTEMPDWLNVPNDTTVHIQNTSLSRLKPGDFDQINDTILSNITLSGNKISVIESGTFDGMSQKNKHESAPHFLNLDN